MMRSARDVAGSMYLEMEGSGFHDGEQYVEIVTGWLMVMDGDDF